MILKGLFLGVMTLFMFDSPDSEAEFISKEAAACRVTCTISVPDGFGGSIGVSGTAGNFLTSCENAREKACKKATQNAFDVLMAIE